MLQVDELEWELMPTGSSKDSSLIESLITLRTSQCVSSKEVIAHLNVNAPNKNKVSILDVYVYAWDSNQCLHSSTLHECRALYDMQTHALKWTMLVFYALSHHQSSTSWTESSDMHVHVQTARLVIETH